MFALLSNTTGRRLVDTKSDSLCIVVETIFIDAGELNRVETSRSIRDVYMGLAVHILKRQARKETRRGYIVRFRLSIRFPF